MVSRVGQFRGLFVAWNETMFSKEDSCGSGENEKEKE